MLNDGLPIPAPGLSRCSALAPLPRPQKRAHAEIDKHHSHCHEHPEMTLLHPAVQARPQSPRLAQKKQREQAEENSRYFQPQNMPCTRERSPHRLAKSLPSRARRFRASRRGLRCLSPARILRLLLRVTPGRFCLASSCRFFLIPRRLPCFRPLHAPPHHAPRNLHADAQLAPCSLVIHSQSLAAPSLPLPSRQRPRPVPSSSTNLRLQPLQPGVKVWGTVQAGHASKIQGDSRHIR
jgi:hypothetical protein